MPTDGPNRFTICRTASSAAASMSRELVPCPTFPAPLVWFPLGLCLNFPLLFFLCTVRFFFLVIHFRDRRATMRHKSMWGAGLQSLFWEFKCFRRVHHPTASPGIRNALATPGASNLSSSRERRAHQNASPISRRSRSPRSSYRSRSRQVWLQNSASGREDDRAISDLRR